MFRPYLYLVLAVSLVQFLTVLGAKRKLDDYILHFEELHYDAQSLHDSHIRHKRSIDKNVNVKLDAFNRTFHLELAQSSAGFAPDFILEVGSKRMEPDLSFLYSGTLKGDAGSHVHGAIIGGVFRGQIHLPSEQETYHIEKSEGRFEEKPVFHSIIYKESDMNLDPYKEMRDKDRMLAREAGTCGYSNSLKWMKETVQSEVVEVNRAKRSSMDWQEVYSGQHNKYTVDADDETRGHRRTKRETLGDKNSCFMSLTSDVMFWRHFVSSANEDVDVARDEILAFFANHLNAINKIYGGTTFQTYNNDISYSGVQFTVQKTKVMTEEDCSSNTNPLRSFCQNNVDVSNFLNMNSLLNHNDFCLAYVFTYRDFSQGTLGLAWVGASNMASGGVCERNKYFTEGSTQVAKSLNTGIVTIINYGKKVASKVSQLTFAHEIGHNFGSPHDSGSECAPYGTNAPGANQGNYIMFASATMGDKPHNSEFSPCSKDNITRVINAVVKELSKKTNCFKQSGPFCGNGILEENEDCDCGFYGDCTDQCCIARNTPNTPESNFCQLATGKTCSPTQGPCCTINCGYVTAAQNLTCRYQQDCASSAQCNGIQAACPDSNKEPDGSFCQKFGFTCVNGECAGSLCDHFGWQECFTTGPSKTKAEQEQLCKLGCRGNMSGVLTDCILSDDSDTMTKNGYDDYIKMVTDVIQGRKDEGVDTKGESSGVQLAPGSPCNNFQGYCDVFHRCRGVDAEGPLSRLKNLIFDPETLQDISNWIQEHWWAVLLMGIGLVLAMGLFIKFCAVHTPSSNPKAKPARKLSETMTLRRRRNQNRQNPTQAQPQPQQVRYPQKDRGSRERDYHYGRNPQGPPPPYPGSSSAGVHVGPPHGHGKKGKGRKSKDIELGRV